MEKVSLRLATKKEKSLVVSFDPYCLKIEVHIAKAISNEECFIVLSSSKTVGFVIFDYRFFYQGWIDLIILDEKYRGMGIGGQVFDLICKQCKADKVFTSTNSSNLRMQRALTKSGFTFAGRLDGLDDDDPELFYYKKIKK